MAALDLLGRRWSLRILWELRSDSIGARALLSRIEGLSSSVLYERLRDLASAGLLEQTVDDEYRLTALGSSLGTALDPLDAWAKRWARSQSRPGDSP